MAHDLTPEGRMRRREFLKGAALAGAGVAAGAVLGQPSAAFAKGKTYATQHVVVIEMAGGVRSRECIGTPSNVPNLMRMAEKGVVLPSVRAANLGHYGAALAIFTGCPDSRAMTRQAA